MVLLERPAEWQPRFKFSRTSCSIVHRPGIVGEWTSSRFGEDALALLIRLEVPSSPE